MSQPKRPEFPVIEAASAAVALSHFALVHSSIKAYRYTSATGLSTFARYALSF
jgi:hypothetical protein